MRSALTSVATLGFLGHIPFAPGTIGTLFALATFVVIEFSLVAHFSVIVIASLLGAYASSAAEEVLQEKDSGKIIIDEFVGFYISVFCIPKTAGFIIAAFLLFRFFDILKPLFIRKLETTLSGGIGVMSDDILAGLYANLALQAYIFSFR